MKKNYKNFAAKSGELFLLAFAGEDSKPAVEMIQEYGLSGLYLSNDNIPNLNSALKSFTGSTSCSYKPWRFPAVTFGS